MRVRAFIRPGIDSGRVAIVDATSPGAQREITYSELDARCDAVARMLAWRGFSRGARIGILASNRVEYLETLFGAMRAGYVPVPLPAKHSTAGLAEIVADAGIQLVFTDRANAERCPDGVRVVDFDGRYPTLLREATASAPATPVDVGVEPKDVALQPYTSGSTGRQRGVLLSHAGHAALIGMLTRVRGMGPTTTMLVATPLHHMYGLLRAELVLMAGGKLVLQVPFDARDFVEAIGRHRVTHLTGVATTYRRVVAETQLLGATDVSSVVSASIGASPFSRALFDDLSRIFPRATVANDFGITECGGLIFGPHPDGIALPPESPGHPLPGVEVRLEPGPDEGELFVKSPGLMLGYHDLPEATAERMKDGWFATRDVFRRDANGFYYFVARADDMFKCAGQSIYPTMVEAILERHPDVRQAAVVPRKSELKGQEPIAFIVLRAGTTVTEDELKGWVVANAAPVFHPRRVVFVPELPLTATMKVDRNALGALDPG
jgi:long-chain acyl-CoA synthetase